MRNNSAKRINERNKRREELIIKEMKSFEERLVLLEQGINKPRGLEKYKIYLDVVFGLFIVTVISIVGLSINRAANEIAYTANTIAMANLNLQLEQHQIMLDDRRPVFAITHAEHSTSEISEFPFPTMLTLELYNIGGDVYNGLAEVLYFVPISVFKEADKREEVFTFAVALASIGGVYNSTNRSFDILVNRANEDVFDFTIWIYDELINHFKYDSRVDFSMDYMRIYLDISYQDSLANQWRQYHSLNSDVYMHHSLNSTEDPLYEFGDNIIFLNTGILEYWRPRYEHHLDRIIEIIENFFS